MGKYSLLILILLTMLAGLVMVMGIHLSGTDSRSTGIQALHEDLEQIAELAQEFYRKPIMLGGGGHSFDGSGRAFGSAIEWEDLSSFRAAVPPGDEPDSPRRANDRAVYEFLEIGRDYLWVSAQSLEGEYSLSIRICPEQVVWAHPDEPDLEPGSCDGLAEATAN